MSFGKQTQTHESTEASQINIWGLSRRSRSLLCDIGGNENENVYNQRSLNEWNCFLIWKLRLFFGKSDVESHTIQSDRRNYVAYNHNPKRWECEVSPNAWLNFFLLFYSCSFWFLARVNIEIGNWDWKFDWVSIRRVYHRLVHVIKLNSERKLHIKCDLRDEKMSRSRINSLWSS